MGAAASIRYGILKTRDLVELYFAGRMVADVHETNFNVGAVTPLQVLKQDPRRISYELVFSAQSGFTNWGVNLGTTFDQAARATGIVIRSAPPTVVIIKRTFFEDLDAICLPVWVLSESGSELTQVGVRDTRLTPVPVDESPLG